MATATLIGLIQESGDQTKERWNVTINRGESAAFDITAKRIARVKHIVSPGYGQVVSGTNNQVRISSYPTFNTYDIDDRSVVGLDDLIVTGAYTGTEPATFTVLISSSAASPDEFKWKKNSGSLSTATAMTGSAQSLSDGVSVTFPNTDGHTLNSTWVITANPSTKTFDVVLEGYGR